ncbi:MAG: NADH-quinone oxidoreductase subunit N [Acidobacteria bacterium]|nr:MAG: NADH-quinone oxidoreductase subunit N [Acidobacteriota bacterium]
MTMSWTQQIATILPELLLTGYAFVLLLVTLSLRKDQGRLVGYLSLLCTVVTMGLVARAWWALPASGVTSFSGMVILDPFGLFLKMVFLLGTLMAILLSLHFKDLERESAGEYYALLLIATVGMMFMASSQNLVMILVSLETMALCTYLLVGYLQHERRSNEAALKYFILGAFSSGIFAYGISLVYGATGSVDLLAIAKASHLEAGRPVLMLGVLLMMVSLGFKIAAVPFHMWVPDAYEGAPSPITAFIATAAKAAAFAVFLRIFAQGFGSLGGEWTGLVAFLAAASMTVGNVAAIMQDNMKRMLAYSSIAHGGYALMALVAVGSGGEAARLGVTAMVVYLLIYTLMNMGAFGFVIMLRRGNLAGDRVADFAGMSRRAPLAAASMLILMLSLAGIPATAGFIGKWYLFAAAIRADYTWLAVVAVINSTISLYYYIRVVVYMYVMEPVDEERYHASPFLVGALALSVVLTLFIGLYPQPLIEFARAAFLG